MLRKTLRHWDIKRVISTSYQDELKPINLVKIYLGTSWLRYKLTRVLLELWGSFRYRLRRERNEPHSSRSIEKVKQIGFNISTLSFHKCLTNLCVYGDESLEKQSHCFAFFGGCFLCYYKPVGLFCSQWLKSTTEDQEFHPCWKAFAWFVSCHRLQIITMDSQLPTKAIPEDV